MSSLYDFQFAQLIIPYPAEEKNTGLEYQTKPDERLFVRIFRMDARLPALWLSTAYPEPLFPAGYACIAKNAKTMMRRSLSWR